MRTVLILKEFRGGKTKSANGTAYAQLSCMKVVHRLMEWVVLWCCFLLFLVTECGVIYALFKFGGAL